ncbi:MAG: 4-alpha-glucanotransferase, partial [Verrucomicrobiota bacterium]
RSPEAVFCLNECPFGDSVVQHLEGVGAEGGELALGGHPLFFDAFRCNWLRTSYWKPDNFDDELRVLVFAENADPFDCHETRRACANSFMVRGMELLPEHKLAGILTPLFALRGPNDLGVGDLGALRDLVDWASAAGLGVVQLLPVNETGNDHSPYNAISSVALDPLSLELTPEAVPELAREWLAEETRRFFPEGVPGGAVAYDKVKPLKRALLHRAFQVFYTTTGEAKTPRGKAFRHWVVQQENWLPDFALFRVLMDEHGTERWDQWPMVHRTAASARNWLRGVPAKIQRAFKKRETEVMYIQWLAWMQWGQIREYAEQKQVALMGDIPFGVSFYSADYFCRPEIFDSHWSGGAPPEPTYQSDKFTARWGQNWGVPLYRWDVLKASQLDWWRQRVRKVREVFHLFRIDHVLGFYRIFGFPWRPARNAEFAELTDEESKALTGGDLPRFHECPDDTDAHRWSNRLHGEELLRILLQETGDFRLIGEDLGTVPDYVRPSLQSLQIAGFKVPMWEKWHNGRLVPGRDYERLSVATYATHDHEPLRTMWERWMRVIAEGESGRIEDAQRRDGAWWEVRRLADWAGFEVPRITPFEQVHEQLLRGLLASESWIAIFMVTDLFGTSQRFNVPGAVADSNWSERIAVPVREWHANETLADLVQKLRPDFRRC